MALMVDLEPLRAFLKHHFRLSKRAHLDEDQRLMPGIINSIGVIEVADFVEEAYGVRVSRADLDAYETNFASLKAIGAMIERSRRDTHGLS